MASATSGARRLTWILVATLAWLAPAAAEAYPQWQLSTGATRCNQCHFAPAGGGLINSYGRDAGGDQLSSFGGNGALLHGAVAPPAWLAVGADLRGALVDNDVQDPGGPTVAVFPMQADLAVRVALPAGFSLSAVGGLRGRVRDPGELVPTQNYQPVSTSQLISREHYVMWQPEALGPYVRIGRFFAPFGLRMAEHILYINRDLGFDELQETYNLSAGVISDRAELHLTIFAPDFIRHIGSDEKGAVAYTETRFWADRVALGAQVRFASAPGLTRVTTGVTGKVYLEGLRTLLLGEVDLVNKIFTDVGDPVRTQLVGAAGFSVLPVAGVVATVLGERNQIDVSFPNSWTAATFLLNWFPYAHVEGQIMGRLQFPSGGAVAETLFVQVHYFF